MKKSDEITNPGGLDLLRLIGVVVGATIASGVFTMSGDLAARGAGTGAVLIGWIVCGVGMLALALCFYGLSVRKPELKGGIYSYAKEGFGPYVGFNSAWGYWLSELLANVSFLTLLFASLGHFFPVFGHGNNLASVIGCSVIWWICVWFIMRGVSEAAAVNLVVTVAKLIPVFTVILAVVFLRAFHWRIFVDNFWGEPGGLPLGQQIKATTFTTVWAFTGIEGAVAISGRAKRARDVGRATIISFLCVLAIYVMISMLSMGVMSRQELAALGNPPLAGVMERVVGGWGAALVNVGVAISLLGATLGHTIMAVETPFEAAKNGAFSRFFSVENKKGAPSNTLLLTSVIIQVFLILLYFNESSYQVFYVISSSMIMVPYLLSALYYLKIVMRGEGLSNIEGGRSPGAWLAALLGTIYGLWMLYAGGLVNLLITALLYAPGILVYMKGRREQGQPYFGSRTDRFFLAAVAVLFVISAALLAKGVIRPF